METLSPEAITALVNRYDRPGPRYTSYPAVPAWNEGFGPSDYAARLDDWAAAQRQGVAAPLSLYVHLPFCRQRCLYCGCNVVISSKHEIVVPYLDTLEREIELVARHLGPSRNVVQLHLGGGTPTYLAPAELERLGEVVARTFSFADDAERSVEVDPRVTTPEHLGTLRALGFDRISLGVQDLDPDVQEAIGRVQPEEQTAAFFETCRKAGFSSINVDLIYGLPLQTAESFAATIDAVVALGPDRVALFSYAHVPHLRPHQAKMPVALLPAPAHKLALYVEAARRFEAAGYTFVGLDHFAKPEDELARAHERHTLRRNFMGFTTKPETDVVAFGMSAISDVSHAYAQNDSHLPAYRRRIEAGELATTRGVVLTPDDRVRRDIIMSLMCNGRTDARALSARHGLDFATAFAPELAALAPLVDDGLLTIDAHHDLVVTARGRWVMRNICMVFDAHLPTLPAQAAHAPARFSRTI
ncbi:MAG: oxygen-independent coproporphyrinogen III oxidase [Myxococcales bacterium]|nr:oxygen-independent coproporphyrinogen III oxidase [Myxococcales bacterium]